MRTLWTCKGIDLEDDDNEDDDLDENDDGWIDKQEALDVADHEELDAAVCKHVAYYSPPNVHIYSLLAEQLCCSVMSLLV